MSTVYMLLNASLKTAITALQEGMALLATKLCTTSRSPLYANCVSAAKFCAS